MIALINLLIGRVAFAGGIAAGGILIILSGSVILGIVLREIGIDNNWTSDLDHFALIWLAFLGAALTAVFDRHVTAGLALENFFSNRIMLRVLTTVRFMIVIGFLIVFLISSIWQTQDSFYSHEATLDIAAWPVWVAKAALPTGVVFWLIAEIHKYLEWLLNHDYG